MSKDDGRIIPFPGERRERRRRADTLPAAGQGVDDDAWRRGYEAGVAAGLEQAREAGESYGRALAGLWRLNAELLERAQGEAEGLAMRIVAAYHGVEADAPDAGERLPIGARAELAEVATRLRAVGERVAPVLHLSVNPEDLAAAALSSEISSGLLELRAHADDRLTRGELRARADVFELEVRPDSD